MLSIMVIQPINWRRPYSNTWVDFLDPKLVSQYLAATDEEKIKEREVELKEVEKQLADSQDGFLKRLDDLLKRKIISEAEFDRANKMERFLT